MRYYRRQRVGSTWAKMCGYCHAESATVASRCYQCGRDLVARPRRARQRGVDERHARESAHLDEWLTKLALAVTKVRYYRGRVKTLDRQRREAADAPPEAGARARAIRLRDH